jgi:hypothetical protein
VRTADGCHADYRAPGPPTTLAGEATVKCLKTKEKIMKLPDYVPAEEVKRVCKAIGVSDWTEKKDPTVSKEEASTILKIVNTKSMEIPLDDFQKGLEVELEHGTRFDDANVTNNHPVLTGKIVIAHLKETMDYYRRIDVAEMEGDLLKAILSRNIEKIESKYKDLIEAQESLNQAVTRQLKKGI